MREKAKASLHPKGISCGHNGLDTVPICHRKAASSTGSKDSHAMA